MTTAMHNCNDYNTFFLNPEVGPKWKSLDDSAAGAPVDNRIQLRMFRYCVANALDFIEKFFTQNFT